MRKSLLIAVLFAATAALGPLAPPANACPMCKAANESDPLTGETNTKPQAYMWSILFMLSMPATLLGTFGFTFWRISRQAGMLHQMGKLEPLDTTQGE
jgi:hypothetical protein